LSAVLDVLAIAAAAVVVLLALVMAWGLDQQGHGGRRWATWLELAFLVSIAATIYGARKTLQDALWGDFPPSPAMRIVQRIASVVVFALPGLLAYAAS
jgi:hypothetical protein